MRFRSTLVGLCLLCLVAIALPLGDFLSMGLVTEQIDEWVTDWTGLEWLGGLASSLAGVAAFLGFVILLVLVYVRMFAVRRPSTPAEFAKERNDAGMALVQQGGYVAAVEELTAALHEDPKCVAALVNRGVAFSHLGKFDEALADFDAALRMDRNLVDALGWRGQTWFKKGDSDKALDDFDVALRLQPANLGVRLHRALVFSVRGDADRALEDYTLAIAAGASDAANYTARGSILVGRGDYDRAVEDFDEAIRRGDRGTLVYCNRGMAWLGKGVLDRAIADFDEAIRIEAKCALAFNNRGAALLRRGDYAQALSDFETAMQIDPKFPNPYKNLAWLRATCPLAEFRDGPQAVAHATQALELARKKVPEWWPIVAAAHAEAGNFEQAIHWQRQAILESPAKMRDKMQTRLELYEAGRAYREGPVA